MYQCFIEVQADSLELRVLFRKLDLACGVRYLEGSSNSNRLYSLKEMLPR